jgi:transmembrane 9 superfamily protein 3
VGPFHNPQEAYEYYSLPYCAPDAERGADKDASQFNTLRSHSIGEYLGGHALRHSGHSIQYAQAATAENENTDRCTSAQSLSAVQAQQFQKAIEQQWFYQMYLDDLPVWGMVGEMKETSDGTPRPHVYTKRILVIQYNQDRVIRVDLHSIAESLVLVQPGIKLTFETEFLWMETKEDFSSRFDRYLDHAFFQHSIHWFSIFNSFMMVLFLTGLVTLIVLRTLRKDFARYSSSSTSSAYNKDTDQEIGDVVPRSAHDGSHSHDDDLEDEKLIGGNVHVSISSEDSGWKQVHGDVFRAPTHLALFAAILGTGWQMLALSLCVILICVTGPLHGEVHEDRGEVQHAILYSYCLSSIVAGFVSGAYFKRYHNTSTGNRAKSVSTQDSTWQITLFFTVLLLPTMFFSVFSLLNLVALTYGTVNYIPFVVVVKLFLVWIFTSIPLHIMGTLAGRRNVTGSFPCRTNTIPRPIPDVVPWHGKPTNLVPFAGLLCIGSIFIELYYIMTSLWNYKFYHVYGFLLAVYAVLVVVVSLTTIIVVYFILNSENYHWQWTAFSSGGSISLYMLLYSLYYYYFKTQMSGFLQTAFYFGYMFLISLTMGVMCGTMGHSAASRFVYAIFRNVKLD